MGFDQPKSLGNREFGSSVALPIWMEFIESNTEDIPLNSSLPPAGLVVVKIDPKTGKRLKDGSKEGIFEYYLQENTPERFLFTRAEINRSNCSEALTEGFSLKPDLTYC